MKLTEEQEQEIWSNVYAVAVVNDIDREEFFRRLIATLEATAKDEVSPE